MKEEDVRIPTYHQANYSILVPVLDMVFEDFIVLLGVAAAFFLIGIFLFQVSGDLMASFGVWAAGVVFSSLAIHWIRQIYRERGEVGSDQVLVDALLYLVRSRRMPGRSWE